MKVATRRLTLPLPLEAQVCPHCGATFDGELGRWDTYECGAILGAVDVVEPCPAVDK